MKITALNCYTLAYLVKEFEKSGIISERDAARFDGPLSPEYIQVPAGKELESQSLLNAVNHEVYKFLVEGAPVVVDLSALKGKDFIKWLRKQVRQFGRRAVVGNVGDAIDNPVEMWLKDLGFKWVSASSMQSLIVNNGSETEYSLSYEFAGLLMGCEGGFCNDDRYIE